MERFSDAKLLDALYAVAVEPERFRELAATWQHYLDQLESHDPDNVASNVERLITHFGRAGSIADASAIKTLDARPSLHDRLDREIQPMFAIDRELKVAAANGPAKMLFPLADGSGVDDLPFTLEDKADIRNAIALTLQEQAHAPVILKATNVLSGSPTLLLVSTWKGFSERKFALLKSTEFLWPDRLTPAISHAFGLTAAEADIVKLIVEGASVSEVADARGSQLSTVRAQIRSLYLKTGAKNQSEFIRMAVGLAVLQLLGKDEDPAPKPALSSEQSKAYPRPEHMRMMRLADNRMQEYAVFGAPAGKPVLFFHNELNGNVWPSGAVEAATLAGLKIIVPSRPYYGNTDPYPRNVFHPEQTADDFAALLDVLEIERVFLCSQTLGSLFALVFADRYPERTAGLLSMSPLLPHSSTATERNMPMMHRFISSVLQRSPLILDFVAKAGTAYYKRVGPLRFLQHAFGDLECDLPILNDPDHQKALIQGLALGTKHGHKGYVAGYRHLVPDAVERLCKLPFPVQLLIGDSDKNTRLERANALIDKGVDIEIVIAKNGGELLYYSHPRLVVGELGKAIQKSGL